MLTDLEDRAVQAARACARAEWSKWAAVLQLREQLIAEVEAEAAITGMLQRMAINAVALDIGRLLHLSEQQVWRITEQASRLRDHVPAAWAAFAAGDLDVQKASVIAVAIERLDDPETRAAVNDVVVGYATTHTMAETRRWLDKLIDRLQPTDITEADAERARRSVDLVHGRNGMSTLSGYIPTPIAVAIGKRLRAGAKASNEPGDDRTSMQKQADFYCWWLTNSTGTECDIRAEVAVVVEATALAGVTDAPAHVIDVDDELPVPVSWVFGIAAADSTPWTRLLTDPAGHVLDVTHLGYQPPQALRRAVQWRDMTCRVSGCTRRAELTDLDHIRPFDAGGPTSGANLQCLCRRHHGMKGHGVLPADAYGPPAVHMVRLPHPTPLVIEYIAA